MTPEQIADCRSDLLEFTRTMFRARRGADMKPNWHQEVICGALERVLMGKCPRLIINISPRSGKTELAVVSFIAWATGIYPDSEWIHASYSKRLATNNAYGVREVMRHEVYQEIFPWVKIRDDSSAKDEFRTEQGGVVYATGSEGSITGRGAGGMSGRFQGCFAYHQMVKTENGDIEIGELVSSKKDYRVWSYCEETGSARLSKILHHWKNPANDIIRIAMSDGSFIDCTPDHEILTDAGWVSAIHFAKALNLVNAESGQSSGLISCEGSVISDFNDAFRVLWLCAPFGIRQMVRDRFPSLSGLNLADNTNTNAVTLCEDGSAFGALEYFNNLFSVEFGSWAALQNRECSMPESVLHIVGLGAIREIAQVVVGGVSVQMTNLIPVGAFTYKLLSDKVRDVFGLDDSANGETDAKVTLPIARRLKKSDGLCPADLSGVRNLVQPEGSRNVFPVGVYYAGHVDSTYCLEVECDNNFILSQSGAVVSNCIVIDDPHKPGEANSDVMRQNVIDWFSTTMESRKNRPDTPIIVIKQRLHENDLTGWLLSGGNGEKWDHIKIPAITDSNESFWPDQFPISMLERMQEANPYVFAGQYMQEPAPRGGGLFKVDRIEIVRAAPANAAQVVRYWDKAGTEGGGAYSAGVKMARMKDGRFIVLDVVRGQWSALNRERMIRQTAEMDGTSVPVWIEQEPGSGGKESAENTIRALAGFDVRAERPIGDKELRAAPFSAQVEAGNVLMLAGAWNKDFIDELRNFPVGKYKDQVDAASAAFAKLAGNSFDLSALL